MRPVCTYLSYKQKLDADLLSNYRRISNLHTISKIVERVFMTKLAEHVKLSPNYKDSSLPTDVATLQRQRCWDCWTTCTAQPTTDSELYSFNLILQLHLILLTSAPCSAVSAIPLVYLDQRWTGFRHTLLANTVRTCWTGTVAQNWLRIRSSPRLCSWAAVIHLVHITCQQRNQFVRDWPTHSTLMTHSCTWHWKIEACQL